MSVTLQIRGGTYSEHTTFSGEERELTVNTTDWTLVVHDGMGNQYPVTGARGVQGIQGSQGSQGIQGNPGLSVFNIVIYLRSSSAPATPGGGSYNFETFTLVPPINGWSDNIPVGSDPLYVSTALASIFGTSGTDSTLTWTTPVILAQDGAPGANTAGSAYDIWLAAGNTGGINAFLDSLTGNTGAPGSTGDSAYQIWLDAGNTGTISDYLNALTGTDGSDGSDGTDGSDGLSIFNPTIYLRSSTMPSVPTGGSYDFGNLNLNTSTITPSGWTDTVPIGSDPLYISNTTASSNSVSGIDSTLTWTTPVILVQNGAAGASDGDSAYQIWLQNGNVGSVTEFLDSLIGTDGLDGTTAYEIWLQAGNTGSLNDFIATFGGVPGVSAYELWLEDGNTGDYSVFFDAISGSDGLSITTVNLYRRSITELTSNDKPTGNGSYNFDTKTLTYDGSGNWDVYRPLVPLLGVEEDLYISESTAFVVGTTGTDSVLSWSNPILQSKVGAEGPPGAGQYSKVITGTGWSDSLAVQAITDTNASRTAPVLGDIVTLLNTNNLSNPNYTGWKSEVRHWAGSTLGWQEHESFIDGNLIVQGSITGDKILANSLSVEKIKSGNTYESTGNRFGIGEGTNIAGYQGIIVAENETDGVHKIPGIFADSYNQNNPGGSHGLGLAAACVSEGTALMAVGGYKDADYAGTFRTSAYLAYNEITNGVEANIGGIFRTQNIVNESGNPIWDGSFSNIRASLYCAYNEWASYATAGTHGPFTGSHDALVLKSSNLVAGDIVVDHKIINKKDVSNLITQVKPSTQKNQKGAVGVYIHTLNDHIPTSLSDLDPTSSISKIGIKINDKYKDLLKDNDIIAINAIGEGQINVCGEGGNLEIGDLITTSSILGKGMKQDDDIIRSYTVAKVRENVTFHNSKDVKLVACIYLCG